MRMIDCEKKCSVKNIALYLTIGEAKQLRDELEGLLKDPEAKEHFHVADIKGPTREISCSIITERKLREGKYTELEQKILKEK